MTALPVSAAYLVLLEEECEAGHYPSTAADEIRTLIQEIRQHRAALEVCRAEANGLWDSGYRTARLEAEGPGPAPLWIQCIRAAATGRVCQVVNDVLSGRRG